MRTIEKKKTDPIICSRCSRWALAVFNKQNLCAHCLIHAENLDLFTDGPQPITPLPLSEMDFMEAFGKAS